VRTVRIVRQDGAAGCGPARGDCPVVRADVGHPVERGALLARSRESHLACGEVVVVQHLPRDGAWIQPLRDPGRPLRLEQAAEAIHLVTRRTGNPRPGHLRLDIAGQPVAADAHDVFRAPAVGQGSGDLELDGDRPATVPHLVDIGVDPRRKGLGVALGVRTIGSPFLGHVTAVEKHARRAVLRHVCRPEILREQPEAALAPEVDLPEPVAGGVVALQENGIPGAPGINVRDPPLVDDELGRLLEAAHLVRALPYCGRHLGQCGGGEQDG
jgi:hypothetical protein